MSRGEAEKSCENAGAGGGEKTWAKKSKKWLTNGSRGCIIFFVSSASVLRTKPNSGDLHSGSAVDSDSTCGSSILSSPTRPQPVGLRYFRGIAQLVARLVRDEEAVGSNPAAPTEKDRYTFVCRSFSISAAGFEQQRSRPPPAAETGRRGWGSAPFFQSPAKGLRKKRQAQLAGGAAGQAISPVGCCLVRGSQSVGMSTVGDYRYTFVCRSFFYFRRAAGFSGFSISFPENMVE